MKKILQLSLGIITSVGGFLEIGSVTTAAQAGAQFGYKLLWAILLRISGMRHPMVEEWPGVTPGRRVLAGFALLMMVVTLTPAPFAHSSLLLVVRSIRGQ